MDTLLIVQAKNYYNYTLISSSFALSSSNCLISKDVDFTGVFLSTSWEVYSNISRKWGWNLGSVLKIKSKTNSLKIKYSFLVRNARRFSFSPDLPLILVLSKILKKKAQWKNSKGDSSIYLMANFERDLISKALVKPV